MDNMDDMNLPNNEWWKGKWFTDYLKERSMSDEEYLDQSNRNSYDLLTGKISMEDIQEGFGMVHNPFKRDPKEIEAIMHYFIETEEYEKCAVLRDMLNDSGEFPRGEGRNHRVEDHLMD
jgi:hypothetical protein